MLDYPAQWVGGAVFQITQLPWPAGTFFTVEGNVRGMLAIVLVCLVCGGMGSLVVGNRMAFFSDALAHCAFAGVGLGLFLCILANVPDQTALQLIRLVMVVFGVSIGLMIAFVRDQTGLASDTVIGVFYAGAIGIGAVVLTLSRSRRLLSLESFIFGNPTAVESWELILLMGLAAAAIVFLVLLHNWLVLASANPSLALSRRVPVRLCRYLFIVLLALMVNLSQQITGTLLINGLLIVPAAAAANIAGNLRQMFWYSIAIALSVGCVGHLISWEFSCRGYPVGISGAIIVLAVLLFVASMFVGRWLRRSA